MFSLDVFVPWCVIGVGVLSGSLQKPVNHFFMCSFSGRIPQADEVSIAYARYNQEQQRNSEFRRNHNYAQVLGCKLEQFFVRIG